MVFDLRYQSYHFPHDNFFFFEVVSEVSFDIFGKESKAFSREDKNKREKLT